MDVVSTIEVAQGLGEFSLRPARVGENFHLAGDADTTTRCRIGINRTGHGRSTVIAATRAMGASIVPISGVPRTTMVATTTTRRPRKATVGSSIRRTSSLLATTTPPRVLAAVLSASVTAAPPRRRRLRVRSSLRTSAPRCARGGIAVPTVGTPLPSSGSGGVVAHDDRRGKG